MFISVDNLGDKYSFIYGVVYSIHLLLTFRPEGYRYFIMTIRHIQSFIWLPFPHLKNWDFSIFYTVYVLCNIFQLRWPPVGTVQQVSFLSGTLQKWVIRCYISLFRNYIYTQPSLRIVFASKSLYIPILISSRPEV